MRPRSTHRLALLATIAAVVLAACGGPTPTGPTGPGPGGVTPAVLLLGNELSELQILRSDASGVTVLPPLLLPPGAEACGTAVRDGRLYVGDYWYEVIYVYDLATALGGGMVEPIATADPNVSSWVEPCGLDFDDEGDLWVGDQSGRRVLTFADPSTWTGDVSPTPTRALRIDSDSAFVVFEAVIDLRFDDQGRLWVVDWEAETLSRFDDPRALPAAGATSVFVTPDLQIDWVEGPVGGPAYSLYEPSSVAFGPDGAVYVGNDRNPFALITRYDDAGDVVDTSAPVDLEPSAYVQAPISNAFTIGFDPDGRLWAANLSTLVRLTGYTGTGVLDASAAATVSLTPDTVYGGGMTWVVWPPSD